MEACKGVGRWEDAFALLKRMQAEGIEPGHINYSRAMQACAAAGHPDKALDFLATLYQVRWEVTLGSLMADGSSSTRVSTCGV